MAAKPETTVCDPSFLISHLYIFVAKPNQTLKTVTTNMNHSCCLQTPTYIFWIWTLGLNENQERFHKKGRRQKILCIIFIKLKDIIVESTWRTQMLALNNRYILSSWEEMKSSGTGTVPQR